MAVPGFDLRSGFNLKHSLICSSVLLCEERKKISFILSMNLSRAQQAAAEVYPPTDVVNVTGGVGPPTPTPIHTHTNKPQIKDPPLIAGLRCPAEPLQCSPPAGIRHSQEP